MNVVSGSRITNNQYSDVATFRDGSVNVSSDSQVGVVVHWL